METSDIRRQLHERREQLTQRLDRIRGDRRRQTDPLAADFADQAVQRENDEALDLLDRRVHAELREIDGALARLTDDTYGECTVCGDAIAPERLDVLPATAHCAVCAPLGAPASPE